MTPNDAQQPELTSTMPRPMTSVGAKILVTWRDGAACLNEDPELIFPIGNNYAALLQIEEAKIVCRRCEVMVACVSWAMESSHDTGLWDGLSEDERHALKRRNARAHRAS